MALESVFDALNQIGLNRRSQVYLPDGIWYDYADSKEVTVTVTGGSVTTRNLSHDYSLEFMG